MLLARCVRREPGAWEDFVDRFIGLVIHVVDHSARSRSVRLTPADRDDLVAEVFLRLVERDMAVLRHFRGQSSLATYLTVVARRIVVKQIVAHLPRNAHDQDPQRSAAGGNAVAAAQAAGPTVEERMANADEVNRLIESLAGPDAEVVRLYHLDGHSYQEISRRMGLPENSVGPILSRARAQMRQTANQPTG
ncbi:RNA polymerase sigma factor [Pirellulimonas nuda]|uniref:RNA polymerase sigma factor n=1 Tax=Pirellulimonas nuda TaxID=2528009 RepID=UPI001E5F3E22|nr:sigma-70 family RNA polymerase sigma factor [Pirellulimonas nuda]